ncbi:hypothetical protein R5R35_008344 [Gryllus longicercus]|uniref:Nicotinamide-nucleotide adenylyltransferase n=1 Tax=Gryllus longicercus TaxID=2509291 RepID=A0AAN9Z0F4_9ORTH
MAPPKVVLLACGAFNPPTIMHLRMFEIARDHMQRMGVGNVVGGVMSPVHDDYGKKELISSTHRCAMLKLALRNSDWINVSTWECQQEGHTRTRVVLGYHQNQLNAVINDNNDSPNKRQRLDDLQWVPDDVKYNTNGSVQVKFLCGADLLESFGIPGLWTEEDIETIVGQHGLVVITREGTNPYKFIYESDILTKHQNNITIVTEWITNEVSSTKIRRALRRSESVKYLIPDAVYDYIVKEGLYGTKENKYLLYPEYNQSQSLFLTPSPSDVNMESPSPTTHAIGLEYGDGCNYSESYIAKPKNGPVTYIRVERVDESSLLEQDTCLSEKLTNEENSKRSTVTYPGQAVQIIATAAGNSKIHKQGLSRPACLL